MPPPYDQYSPTEWCVRSVFSRDSCNQKLLRSPATSHHTSRTIPGGRDSIHGRPPDAICGHHSIDQDGPCLSDSLCGASLDTLRALPSMLPPSSSALVLSPGVSLLQAGVGMSGLGVGGVVGLGGMMGIGAGGSGLNPPVNIDLPEPSVISAEEVASGVQMGIKVRGLDLMRYGRLEDGVYKCSECERLQIPKTFKTSYSFQRHAYLYHEGRPKRFPCPVCGKEFSRPDKRKSHLKEKHGLFQPEPTDQPEFHSSL